MTREEILTSAINCGAKVFDSGMVVVADNHESGNATMFVESFYRAAFAAGQAEMRERAAIATNGFSHPLVNQISTTGALLLAQDIIRALPIGENE